MFCKSLESITSGIIIPASLLAVKAAAPDSKKLPDWSCSEVIFFCVIICKDQMHAFYLFKRKLVNMQELKVSIDYYIPNYLNPSWQGWISGIEREYGQKIMN